GRGPRPGHVRGHVAHHHRCPTRPARVPALRRRRGGVGRPRAGAALVGADGVLHPRRCRLGLAGAALDVLGGAAGATAGGV
ncbi:MAG: hypothetical protein AVDCRST_MAG08-2181, partial [uncultured Acetobacteraceae bacterium]